MNFSKVGEKTEKCPGYSFFRWRGIDFPLGETARFFLRERRGCGKLNRASHLQKKRRERTIFVMSNPETAKAPGKGRLIAVLIAVVVVLAIVLVCAGNLFAPKTTEGAKSITISVVDDAGEISTYEVKTDAEYLSEVFDEVDELTVEGYESSYGLYITTINGVTADYDADCSYWSIYVNGEYGMYGADSQVVTDGDEYTFCYEVYSWD